MSEISERAKNLKTWKEFENYISFLEAEVAELRTWRDGHDIKDKLPETGEPIRVQLANGNMWTGYIYDPVFERQKIDDSQRIVRWWKLPEVKS